MNSDSACTGQAAEYDDVMKVYDDFICIPKDFDNPKEQLDAILKSAEQKMLEIKKAHNKRCRSLLMEEC